MVEVMMVVAVVGGWRRISTITSFRSLLPGYLWPLLWKPKGCSLWRVQASEHCINQKKRLLHGSSMSWYPHMGSIHPLIDVYTYLYMMAWDIALQCFIWVRWDLLAVFVYEACITGMICGVRYIKADIP